DEDATSPLMVHDKGWLFILRAHEFHALSAPRARNVRICWTIHTMARTPSLDALRIFAVAARHLSFTEAACELNLTQSAVSHRIRGLEEELGFSLFNRLTRRLELTAQGRTLAQRVDRAIGEIDRGIVDLWKTE